MADPVAFHLDKVGIIVHKEGDGVQYDSRPISRVGVLPSRPQTQGVTILPMSAARSEITETARRNYRLLVGAAVTMAAVGAPVFMQGAVGLATWLAAPVHPAGDSPAEALGAFALSALPLLLAWLAWRGTQYFRRYLDRETWAPPREHSP